MPTHLPLAATWFLAFTAALTAQTPCAPQWAPGNGVPGTSAAIHACTSWDPDGPGPALPRLVIGGDFATASTLRASRIAQLDPATGLWSTMAGGVGGGPVGVGPGDLVTSLLPLPGGDLIAAGYFHEIGGTSVSSLARWDGTAWFDVGNGIDGVAYCLAWLTNGGLVVGGSFQFAGSVAAANLARYDGVSWSPLGNPDQPVRALQALANGDLVIGGEFTNVGGIAANHVARWNGAQWNALGGGTDDYVLALATMANGDLAVGGGFGVAGGVPASRIARWNGTTWSAIGTGLPSSILPGIFGVYALHVQPNGDLVAAGNFLQPSSTLQFIARWDGTAWQSVGRGLDGWGEALASLPNGDLVVGGWFRTAGSKGTSNLAAWNGTGWRRLAEGCNGPVHAVARWLVVGHVLVGWFSTIGGIDCKGVALWDGTAYVPLGTGIDGGEALCVAVLPGGDIVVGGNFASAGGVPCNHLARWNGTTWVPFGSGADQPVHALLVTANGDLVAAGQFTVIDGTPANGIAHWNGALWSPLGAGPQAMGPMTELANGNLVSISSWGVELWDGSTWSTIMPPGSGYYSCVQTLANGDLLVGGWLWTPWQGPITAFRWDPTLTTATTLPNLPGEPRGFLELPTGELVAMVAASGSNTECFARWTGSSWVPFAPPLGARWQPHVRTALVEPNGDLLAFGDFETAGGEVNHNVARLVPPCRAVTSPYGAPCASSAGPVSTQPDARPWLGSTFTAFTVGVPANSIALGVFGFAPAAVPLPSILPQGVAGCSLLATPDVVAALVPAGGVVLSSLAIPNAPGLASMLVYHQVLPLEFSPAGGLLALTGGNGLQLTLGGY